MKSAWSIVGKVAVGFAVIVLLSLGLCGYSMQFGGNGGSDKAMGIGLVGFGVGCVGLVLTGLAAIIVALTDSSRRTPPPPPPTFRPPPPPAG